MSTRVCRILLGAWCCGSHLSLREYCPQLPQEQAAARVNQDPGFTGTCWEPGAKDAVWAMRATQGC